MTERPQSPFATAHRTHTCGELRAEHVGATVALAGAVDEHLDDATIELRDAYGKTLVRFDPQALAMLNEGRDRLIDIGRRQGKKRPAGVGANRLTPESTIRVKGKVLPRETPDPGTPTGAILVEASEVETFTLAKAPLILDFNSEKVPVSDRLRHRYIWLRNPKIHDTFKFRTDVLAEIRRFLAREGFDEVETPLLANRWTAVQKEPFFAIRGPRQVFALPGERPIHQPLLMAAGFDRTYEIAHRFRRKPSYGPFQQPEFTVLDMALAFVSEADLHRFEDELCAHVWKAALGKALETPIPEITHEEALERYGTDCPDLRFGLEIQDATAIALESRSQAVRAALAPGASLRAIRVPAAEAAKGAAGALEAGLAELGPELEAAGRGTSLAWLEVDPAASEAEPAAPKAVGEPPVAAALFREVLRGMGADRAGGDVVVLVQARDRRAASAIAGHVRSALGRSLGLAAPGAHALVRILRLPYYSYDAGGSGWTLCGDALTRPVEDELGGDPHGMHGLAHYLVLNGVNIGGGSIRNHDRHLQHRLFKILGLSSMEIDHRFEQVVSAFRFGVPPHGRIGIGVDRLVALLRGLTAIHEVIPLPKAADGTDGLQRSPFPIEIATIRGYFGV